MGDFGHESRSETLAASRRRAGGAPSGRWMVNANWFQIVMPAYNVNCWLPLFNREEQVKPDEIRHVTLVTARQTPSTLR